MGWDSPRNFTLGQAHPEIIAASYLVRGRYERGYFGMGGCSHNEKFEIKKSLLMPETSGESVPRKHSYKCPKEFLLSFFREKKKTNSKLHFSSPEVSSSYPFS